jgi:hypothetical protein
VQAEDGDGKEGEGARLGVGGGTSADETLVGGAGGEGRSARGRWATIPPRSSSFTILISLVFFDIFIFDPRSRSVLGARCAKLRWTGRTQPRTRN